MGTPQCFPTVLIKEQFNYLITHDFLEYHYFIHTYNQSDTTSIKYMEQVRKVSSVVLLQSAGGMRGGEIFLQIMSILDLSNEVSWSV